MVKVEVLQYLPLEEMAKVSLLNRAFHNQVDSNKSVKEETRERDQKCIETLDRRSKHF